MKQLPALFIMMIIVFNSCTNPADDSVTPATHEYTYPERSPDPRDLPGGWADKAGMDVSPGGAAAESANIYYVSSRSDFLNALNCGGGSLSSLPKIIYIDSMIDILDGHDGDYYVNNTSGLSRSYTDYNDYMISFAVSCGNGSPAGLEADQNRLYNAQKAETAISIPSNTSILGIGSDGGVTGGQLSISNASNVVIRNIAVLDACDYFPSWYQSGENNFNSEYDNLTISTSTGVWIDHCRFSDGASSGYATVDTADQTNLEWVTYDGLIDVVRGSDFVTISWNRIENHDKTMLFGNSDSSTQDQRKLRITMHHNYFKGTDQRLPRVRFGKVHIYNNYYENVGSYSIGVGDHSRIYSEANDFFSASTSIKNMDDSSNEGYIWDSGSLNIISAMLDTAELVGWTPADEYSYTLSDVNMLGLILPTGTGTGQF